MDDTIITIYCLCEEFLEAFGHRDDPQVRLSTAEVMTVPLVSAAFVSGNIDKTRLFLHEYGYMKEMIPLFSRTLPYLYVCCLGAYPGQRLWGSRMA
jgi:hypothetical protein